jgi:twitching motility protein PilT
VTFSLEKEAALIEHINCTRRAHIITLEDPIEYLFEDKLSVIKQREVGIDTRDFSTGLRNILRQDPDVLVIGEIRDAESASAAMSIMWRARSSMPRTSFGA